MFSEMAYGKYRIRRTLAVFVLAACGLSAQLHPQDEGNFRKIGSTMHVKQFVISEDGGNSKENRNFDIDIIATGDIAGSGGVSEEAERLDYDDLRIFAEETRRVNPNVVMMDCGNFVFGAGISGHVSSEYDGNAYYAANLARMIGYNVMNVGKYDLSYGAKILGDCIEASSSASEQMSGRTFFVSQNVRGNQGTMQTGIADKFKIFNLNGFKIGVVGLVWHETAHPSAESDSDLTFDIDFDELQIDINSLKRVVDCVVLLGNIKCDEIVTHEFPSMQMALEKIKGVDLVVNCDSAGGREFFSMVFDSTGKAIPMVVPDINLKSVVLIRLHVRNGVLSEDVDVRRISAHEVHEDSGLLAGAT